MEALKPGVLVELSVVAQQYRAVLEVPDGATVSEVARRYGVARQTLHGWLRRYADDGGIADRGRWHRGRLDRAAGRLR